MKALFIKKYGNGSQRREERGLVEESDWEKIR
jgi:hypothetical protein